MTKSGLANLLLEVQASASNRPLYGEYWAIGFVLAAVAFYSWVAL